MSKWWPLRIATGLVLAGTISGCRADPEREALKQFLHAYGESLGHPYDDKLRGYPEEERRIRWHVLYSRDQLDAIDTFLSKNPPLGERARAVIDDLRQNCLQEVGLHEGLLKEKRFQLTAEEKKVERLRAEFTSKLEVIGRMVDGKE